MCLRKQKRDNLLFIELLDVDASTEDEIASDDLEKYIEAAMLQLPSRESLVLRLFYLEEMSLQAVTDATGWSVNNVKVILHRARKRIKVIINELIKKDKHASR
jgi:RNA polymerase sigma-70 factor (ECF subfamily)